MPWPSRWQGTVDDDPAFPWTKELADEESRLARMAEIAVYTPWPNKYGPEIFDTDEEFDAVFVQEEVDG
jgi:hypothetical protein